MMAGLVLALSIGAGIGPVPGTSFSWEIEAEEGTVAAFATPTWVLEFTPAPYRRWRARYNVGGPWSPWSGWYPPESLFPGDADGDCVVGAPDIIVYGRHFGQSCP